MHDPFATYVEAQRHALRANVDAALTTAILGFSVYTAFAETLFSLFVPDRRIATTVTESPFGGHQVIVPEISQWRVRG